MNKKIIILIITLVIIIIPNKIKAYELETESGYEYSKTLPESGYSYHHTECNGTKVKEENVTYNEQTKTFSINGITEQNNCKFYFNKNGEEIIRTYEVQATVLNGTIDGETTKVVRSNENTTFSLNPTDGYGNPTVTCTNNQTGSITNNTLTVSNVTNDTVCTVEFKELTAADTIISKYTENNTEGLIKLNQPETEQTPALVEYRYSGSNDVVKNYINFNNETWRIIGVSPVDDGTGNCENRLKIIREESIGDYSWDSSEFDFNVGNGINQWGESGDYEGADLMRLLNPGYEGESVNNSLYWNRGSGTCYNRGSNGTTTCDFSSTGLTEEAKSMIEDAKWYTPASDYEITTAESYIEERKSTTSQFTDGIVRTQNWIGKVGLMYPSDYGYASSGCRGGEQPIDQYDNETCKSTNWLFNNNDQSMLAPNPVIKERVHFVISRGFVVFNSVSAAMGVHPTTYLSPSVKITGGDGSLENMYELEV